MATGCQLSKTSSSGHQPGSGGMADQDHLTAREQATGPEAETYIRSGAISLQALQEQYSRDLEGIQNPSITAS